MRFKHVLLLATASVCAAIIDPVVAAAQEATSGQATAGSGSDGIGDIVVTANRRDERLQSVGVAVTALGADELANRGINDPRDISKVAPGVIFDAVTSGNSSAMLTIRGVSQTDYSPHQEAPNSVYVDDIYLPAMAEYAYPLYDIGRVELLRGPQGTLRGRASSGGLMSMSSARPTKELEGYAQLAYGSYNEIGAEGAVSGPLSEKIRFRLSGRLQYNDGWWKNYAPGGKNADQRKFWGLRGQVEADVTENLTARVMVMYDKTPTAADSVFRPVAAYVDGNNNPQLVGSKDVYGYGPGTDALGIVNSYGPRKGEFPSLSRYDSDMLLTGLYLDWQIGDVTISSITGYQHYRGDYYDTDGSVINAVSYSAISNLKQYSQELRASSNKGPLRWTVGTYFLKNDTDMSQQFLLPFLSGTDYAFNVRNPAIQHTTSIAAFAQFEYDLTDKLKATLGGRVTYERKTFDSKLDLIEFGSNYGTPASLDFSSATVGNLARHKETLVSGKFALDYKASSNALFYASVSRGIKTAGFNANVSAANTDATTPFRSEYLYAYELGAKLDLLERHLRVNSAFYYNDYHHFQGYAFLGAIGTVRNYDGRMYGFETEVTAKLPAGFEVAGAVSYSNSRLHDVPTAYGDLSSRDMKFAMAPTWTYNASVAKTFDIGQGSLRVEWNGNYLGERYVSIDNNLASYLPSKFEHNARISYDLDGMGLQLALWVNNISNNSRPIAVSDYVRTTGNINYSYGRPRWYGGSIKKTF